MTGKIYCSTVEYYNVKQHKTMLKLRPVLILAGPRNNDYTVLPISTITKKENLDLEYDVELNPSLLEKLKLNRISYVRTHKRMTVHSASINLNKNLGDLKQDYSELYLEIIRKMENYNERIKEEAMK